ncbi:MULTISPECIES: ISNCY family transposase [Bacillus]|uniref:DDE transposase n=7 Tax=Bacillus cereus group TaxID=86661 RepID=A0A242WCR9_BACTU|nr:MULTISPECIES: ISNCY family transposase [Bacillus]AJI08457.1 transposase DDE domain protein [Bacillus cereus 03BB108]AJI10104.1 transposase DDE domain protein [Bacillus cereus 03BB108]EDX59773.1 transposase [Bacillus cereus 03BB108]KMQ23712.1 transposase [Bacillus cereus]KMQ31364.1 transposase [Bacillus cereus]
MITKFDENQSILQILFAYVDSLTIGGVPPVTGRPPICRKALLKCFFLKTVFQIDSLRKLTRFLHQYPSFRVSCGLYFVPHVSTFSRVGTWFREKGIPIIHEKVLQELNLELIPCVLIDSTALRSSLYDSQAKWGKSTRYGWYKGYKAHVCSTPEGVVLSYAFTTANVHDSKMAPVLLQDIQDQNVLFSVADAAYDSQRIYEIARTCNVFAMNPINPRNGEQNKSTHRRVLSHFIQTILGKQLMKERGKIEQQFSKLKDKGLEQPRWYGQNRYLLHVQLVFLIHNIAYLF